MAQNTPPSGTEPKPRSAKRVSTRVAAVKLGEAVVVSPEAVYRWQQSVSKPGGRQSAKRVTINDVAKHAEVDGSTVSLALRGDPRITEATRARVLQAAKMLGYVPNELAKSMRGGRTRVLGVMLTDLNNRYFARPLEEFQTLADEKKFTLSVKFSSWDTDREERGLGSFCESRADGIIWATTSDETEGFGRMLRTLAAAHMPVVLLAATAQKPPLCHQVGVTGEMDIALQYLVDLGHRRIGFACASRMEGWRSKQQIKRRDQFIQRCTELGLTLAPQDVLETTDNEYGGVQLAMQLVGRPREQWPTALLAADDMIGRAMVAGLHALGVKIPDEISVMGIDDAPGDEDSILPLTSVDMRAAETGREAMNLLIGIVEGDIPAQPFQTKKLQPRVAVRSTCAPPSGK